MTRKEALEQEETIPFDIELFQAGLMNMPDGMTNGDVIKAIFPKSRKIDTFDNGEGIYIYLGNRETIGFSMSWWNAPYKKSEE